MCALGTQFCTFITIPCMIINLFSPKQLIFTGQNCPSIFLETDLLISKFRNTAPHNALQSSYSRSGSYKLDWTGRAHKRPLSQIDKEKKRRKRKKLPEQLLLFAKCFLFTFLPIKLTPFFSHLAFHPGALERRFGRKHVR